MDKLQAISVFIKVVDCGSLTAAADELGKSLPTVVRILASLEESLQVRLLNRSTRRIAITEEGKFYLEQCRRILADLDETERALLQEQVDPTGLITVTAPVGFGGMHVSPAVAGFLKKYPKTQVNLLLLDRVVDLLEEGVDVAIRIGHLRDSSLVAKTVGRTRRVLCASPELLKRIGTPTHPHDLQNLPCVNFSGMAAGSTWEFRNGTDPLSVRVSSALSCNNVSASVAACVAGVGIGSFYCYQVAPWLQSGELVTILADYDSRPVPINLVFPHARLLAARVRAMVEWLTDHVGTAINATR